MSKSQSYWEKRKARELYEELIEVEDAAEEMRQVYIQASNEVQEKARKIVKRFQLKHNLSNAAAEKLLSKITSPDDIEEMIRLLKLDPDNAELIAELEAPAYSARIRQLSALQASLDQVARTIFDQVKPKMQRVLEKIGRGMYFRQIFEMQQRAGAAFPFMPIDEKRLQKVLQTKWAGANFSERLWGNTEELAAAVKEQILLGILTGKSQRAMSEAIDGRFSKGFNVTRRLVRTEANYVANQMQAESYKEHGVEKYIYVAILDLRTSPVCRGLDKKVFKVEDAMPGENYPPMHPWCRSTTIAWMPSQLLKKLRQAAIDPETGETIHVSGDMTYNEWYEKYVKDNPALVSEKAQAAVTRYVSSDAYKINEKLRNDLPLSDDEKTFVADLDTALEQVPQYHETVYRSIDSSMIQNKDQFFIDHEAGNIVNYKAYTSASKEIYDSSLDVQMIIDHDGVPDIESFNTDEREVLFPRGADFKVLKRVTQKGADYIWLKKI